MNVQTVAVFAAFFGIVTSAASVSSDSASWEEPDEISVGTWNSFDIIFAPDREIRRNYVFSNADNLFGDLDILCSQEAFSPNAISEFTSAFNFDYEFGSSDSPLLEQSCPDDVVNEIADPGGRLYECTQSCKGSLLTSGVSWIFCIYLTCFSSLIDTSSGVTNRTIDPQLFDIGKQLDLSACGGCLWQSWYVENDFETNQGLTSDEALEKLLDRCQSDPQNVNYKVNPGIILYSNIKANKIEYIDLPAMFFLPRGYIKAEFDEFTVICTHLEPPNTNIPFIAFDDDIIDDGITFWDQVIELELELIIEEINSISSETNLIVLGDFNTGHNGVFDYIYDDYILQTGLTHVFGDLNSINEVDLEQYCTFSCDGNIYASSSRPNVIVDHILFRGSEIELEQGSALTFITDVYEIAPDEFRPLSDHYGVRAVLEL